MKTKFGAICLSVFFMAMENNVDLHFNDAQFAIIPLPMDLVFS